MDPHWAAIGSAADDALVTASIVVLVVRQFRWRTAETHRMLRLPAILLVTGAISLLVQLRTGPGRSAADLFGLVELALVLGAGAAMGLVTRFRVQGTALQYRLTGRGLGLWLLLIGVRAGSLLVADRLGAHLLTGSGAILLAFGANRLAAVAVVRGRARRLGVPADRPPLDRAPGRAPRSPRPRGGGRGDAERPSLGPPSATPGTPPGRGRARRSPTVRSG